MLTYIFLAPCLGVLTDPELCGAAMLALPMSVHTVVAATEGDGPVDAWPVEEGWSGAIRSWINRILIKIGQKQFKYERPLSPTSSGVRSTNTGDVHHLKTQAHFPRPCIHTQMTSVLLQLTTQ